MYYTTKGKNHSEFRRYLLITTYSRLGDRMVNGTLLASSKLQSFIMSQVNSEVHVVPVSPKLFKFSPNFYKLNCQILFTWSGESADPDVIFPDWKVVKFVCVWTVERMVDEIARLTSHETFGVRREKFFEWTLEGFRYDSESEWVFLLFFLIVFGRHGDQGMVVFCLQFGSCCRGP